MKKLTTEEFIEKARKVHGDKYDYSKVTYVNNHSKVIIVCPLHGEFLQTPNKHLQSNRGCPECKKKEHKNKICGVGINDSKVSVYTNGKANKSYRTWLGMIERCYNTNELKKHPTYIYCTVCDSWLKYSNFKKWFDKNYKEGFALDKDILQQGNLTYSPNTCCFVPIYINSLITDCAKRRGQYKLGVTKNHNKFVARTHINGKIVFLGSFDNEDEAHEAYKREKLKEISRVAHEAYISGDINKNVYDALLRWKIYEY